MNWSDSSQWRRRGQNEPSLKEATEGLLHSCTSARHVTDSRDVRARVRRGRHSTLNTESSLAAAAHPDGGALQYAARRRTTTARSAFTLLSLIVWVGLGKVLARHEVHDGGAAERQPERAQRHRAVQEAALVDESQDLRAGHAFGRPVRFRPVIVDVYCDITRRVHRAEHKLLRLAGHQDQTQVYLISWDVFCRHGVSPSRVMIRRRLEDDISRERISLLLTTQHTTQNTSLGHHHCSNNALKPQTQQSTHRLAS